jgi:hypothetical protein
MDLPKEENMEAAGEESAIDREKKKQKEVGANSRDVRLIQYYHVVNLAQNKD